jgi:hypothetical protein
MSIVRIRTRARVRRCVAAVAPAVVALALPVSAHALDAGIVYDSGSPAGKEYAIPLVQGRAEGAGTEDQSAAANTPFGVGIKPPGSGGGKGAGGSGQGAGHTGQGAGSGKAGAGGAGAAGSSQSVGRLSPALRARLAAAEDTGGTLAWTLAFALAVLAAAAILAIALRSRPARPVH